MVAGEEVEEEAVRVKIAAYLAFFLGLVLLIFSSLGIILNWKGDFLPFLLFGIVLLVVASFFFRESEREQKELEERKKEEEEGGDDFPKIQG